MQTDGSPVVNKEQTCATDVGDAHTTLIALAIEVGSGLASVNGNTGGNRGVRVVVPLELESSSSSRSWAIHHEPVSPHRVTSHPKLQLPYSSKCNFEINHY